MLRLKFNKFIVAVLVVLMVFSPFTAKKAEAFFIVDWVNFAVNAVTSIGTHAMWIKEYALDALAYQIVDMVIQKITASTVTWINSGFNKSPAFVANPEAYFQTLGDQAAGQFIFKDPNLNFLCGPIRAKIRIALSSAYNRDNIRWQCTLTQVGKNMDDFMNDFDNGGWDSFFQVSQDQHMNPIGAYIQAEGELFQRIANKTDQKNKELSFGKGFLSFKTCKTWSDPLPADQIAMDQDILPDDIASQGGRVCLEPETSTPGTIIENKLNSVLNIGNQRIAVSDEINEIISALLNQVTSRIVGGIGAGLRGLSSPGSGSQPPSCLTNPSSPECSRTFTQEISNPTNDNAINNYFNTSQQSVANTINQPLPNPYECRDNPNLPQCLPPAGAPCDVGIDPSCVNGTTP